MWWGCAFFHWGLPGCFRTATSIELGIAELKSREVCMGTCAEDMSFLCERVHETAVQLKGMSRRFAVRMDDAFPQCMLPSNFFSSAQIASTDACQVPAKGLPADAICVLAIAPSVRASSAVIVVCEANVVLGSKG
jgi:hypothetical protein